MNKGGSRNENIQRELGQSLAKLHIKATTTEGFGFDVTSFCGTTELNNAWKSNWSQFWKTQRMQPLLNQVAGQNKDLDQCGKEICTRMDHWLGQDVLPNVKPALLHGDLWSGNWAVSDKKPVIFDPASYYGHYEAEFGIMKMFGGFSQGCFDAYYEAMSEYDAREEEEGRKDRLILYELYHHLNHYAMFGGSYGSSCLDLMERIL
jgi:protein-ribulosamine 3-kinase